MNNKILDLVKPNSDNLITDPSRVSITILLVLFFIGIVDSVVR